MGNGRASAFWFGGRQADVDTFDASAKWAHGPTSGQRIRCLNRAFEIYHQARWRIDRCEERERHAMMIRELEDAATTGWGLGVTDLDQAFEHLIDNKAWIGGGGSWTDNTTKFLAWDPHNTCIGEESNSLDDVPSSAANFLMAIDKRLKKLREYALGHAVESKNAEAAHHALDWHALDHAVEKIVLYGKSAQSLLWWVPRVNHALHGPTTFFECLNALFLYQQGREAGLNPTAAGGLTAAYLVVSFGIPGIGLFYAEMIRGIPGLVMGVGQEITDYFDRLDTEAGIRRGNR